MKKLTKKQKMKIAIATDVIAQIKARRYVAMAGIYVGDLDLSEEKGDLQCVIKKKVTRRTPCTVCGLGSAFISAVRLYNKFPLNDKTVDPIDGDVDNGAMRAKLEKFFSWQELNVIEASFEVDSAHILGLETQEKSRSAQTYKEFLLDMSEENRLVWIMQAIIEQDGKPTLYGFITEMLRDLAYDKKFANFRVKKFGS